jgi:phosphoglycerol transferase MdoB-like AlkP superfamily enzyme
LLENTVVVLFGDHCGIHKFSGEAVSKLPAAEQKWMENGYGVPLLVYHKRLKGENIERIRGQIDLLPTICGLMGVAESEFAETATGRNLLKTKKSFAVLVDGTYVASDSKDTEKEHALRGVELSSCIMEGNYFEKKLPAAHGR